MPNLTEEEFNELMAKASITGQLADNSFRQNQMNQVYSQQDSGLAETQLEVDSILDNIENLLKGNRFDWIDETKTIKGWIENKNPQAQILSEWGVQRVMQTVRFHINRNTLLSNFDEKQIDRMMLAFVQAMNSLVLLKYEVLFKESTFEECKDIFDKNKEEKIKIKKFAYDSLGKQYTDDQVKKEVEKELESRIEYEIQKIRNEQLTLRLKEYDLLLEELEQQVFATYNRALRGEERGSLRRHTQFSDIRTTGATPSQQKRGLIAGLLSGST